MTIAPHPVLTGGCRCGGVRFEISEVLDAGYCHCSQCRRRSGAPVFAFVSVKDADFVLLQGEMVSEPSETAGERYYCDKCRAEITLRYENPEFGVIQALGLGLLDRPALVQPVFHQFYTDRLDWLNIEDDLPAFPVTRSATLETGAALIPAKRLSGRAARVPKG